MRHVIKESSFKEWEQSIRLASSYGNGSSKSLDMFVDPFKKFIRFTITDHKEEIASVPDFKEAINVYNSVP